VPENVLGLQTLVQAQPPMAQVAIKEKRLTAEMPLLLQ
jgi:hypothetical protein